MTPADHHHRTATLAAPLWPSNDDILRDLWAEGLSGSAIAMQIEGATKVAVISRARRLGLNPRLKNARKGPRSAWKPKERGFIPMTRSAPPMAFIDPTPAPEPVFSSSARRLSFAELDGPMLGGQCRYIHGDVGTQDWFYCGAPALTEKSYCREHWQITRQAPR